MTAIAEKTIAEKTIAERPITNSYSEAIASEEQVYVLEHYGVYYHTAKYRGEYKATGQTYIYRCVYDYHDGKRFSGLNEYLLKNGSWGYTSDNDDPMLFADKPAAMTHIATLPPARLHKPFEVGDRVRTIKAVNYGEKESPRLIVLTGTINHIHTNAGYGFSSVTWDARESYWGRLEPYTYDIELLPIQEDPRPSSHYFFLQFFDGLQTAGCTFAQWQKSFEYDATLKLFEAYDGNVAQAVEYALSRLHDNT